MTDNPVLALTTMSDDPVLALAAVIEEKERATEGMDPVAAAKIEAERATLYSYFDMAIPTSAEGAAAKLRKAADCVDHDFLYNDGCDEAAEALLGQIAERVAQGENEASDVAVLRFMEAVLRYLDENKSPAADLIGSTLQWLARPKLV